jgi:hypothetical protein
VRQDTNQLKQAWQTYHESFELNVIPTGHEKIVALAFDAYLDTNLKVRLADYLQVAPAQVLEALRGYLKIPTFSVEIKKLLSEFIPHFSERGVTAIPAFDKITGIRKAEDRNSYAHFYDTRIDNATFEKMLRAYGGMATGIAVLLRPSDRLCVIDFDNKEILVKLLNELGYTCDAETIEQTLLRVFPENPIVATFRGYHVYFYDADIAEAVKTTRKLSGIDVKVSRGYVLLPPSLAGFEPTGATLNLIHYRQIRPLLPETIREPLPAKIKDYLLAQIRPHTVSVNLGVAPALQQPATSDLKLFVVDTFVPYWKRGVRDSLTYTLAGVLRRASISLNDALDIVSTICDRAGDEEKRDRLYQVRRQYSLPFQPNGNSPFCAGIRKFREACMQAGMPLQVFNTLIARIFGLKITTNLLDWLEDYRQIAEKIAAIVRNDIVFNETTMSWWAYREDLKRWVETKREEILHFVVKAAFEVRNDIEELVKMSHDNTIPKQVAQKLNRLLNAQFIRNNVLPTLEILLSVNFTFPCIPSEVAQTLPAPVTRLTAHRNGVLLWLKNGDTVFFPSDSENPAGDVHRRFYITNTIDSTVDENADMQPFIDKVTEWVGGRENAEYLLQHLASVLGLGKNINHQFLLFIGDGRNGKNSFIQTLEAAFGNLVRYTTSEILTARKFDNSLYSSLSNLEGCAFAVIDEAPDPAKWNVETVKRLTGGEKTLARRLYHNVETIDITWIFIVLTNEYPSQFKRQSQGLAHRIVAINFPMTYSDSVVNEGRFIKRRNPEEVEYFRRNSQIVIQAMRWAFKQAAQKNFVLTEPEPVSSFTKPIKLKADSVSYFLSKYTIDDARAEIPLQELYQAYRRFVEEEGIGTPLPDNVFAMRLYTKNIQHERRNGRTYIIGLRLRETALLEPANSLVGGNGDGDGKAPEPDDGQDYLDQFPF